MVSMAFQLTRPRGTRLMQTRRKRSQSKFQLTRPRGTRRKFNFSSFFVKGVSTHASAGDATKAAEQREDDVIVSTHASAGDATDSVAGTGKSVIVSTHASAGDATSYCGKQGELLSFNSRVRGGRDPSGIAHIFYIIGVSTHASAGDATDFGDGVERDALVSTHASAGDATLYLKQLLIREISFNSRVRGGRDKHALSPS